MPTNSQPLSNIQNFGDQAFLFYCKTCHLFFGKTFSVMAGEAEEQGKWYGLLYCASIDWLLRDPRHCQNELQAHRAHIRHKRFLLSRAA